MVSLWPTEPGLLSVLAYSYQSSLSLLSGVTIGSQQQSRRKWVKACRYCRYPKTSWGNSHMRFPQWLMGKLPNGVHYAAIRNYIPLIPSQNHICLFPNLLLPPSHEALSLGLWMLEERNESLWQHPAQLEKPHIHSPFLPSPMGDISGQMGLI